MYLITNDTYASMDESDSRAYITKNMNRVKRKMAESRKDDIQVINLENMTVYDSENNRWDSIIKRQDD